MPPTRMTYRGRLTISTRGPSQNRTPKRARVSDWASSNTLIVRSNPLCQSATTSPLARKWTTVNPAESTRCRPQASVAPATGTERSDAGARAAGKKYRAANKGWFKRSVTRRVEDPARSRPRRPPHAPRTCRTMAQRRTSGCSSVGAPARFGAERRRQCLLEQAL